MKNVIQNIVKFMAYGIFFLGALVFFVYLTLPIDEAKAYLVRLASDSYDADLEITDLSISGLSTVKAEGLVLKKRPTPELLAKIREAREARRLWREEQKRKVASQENPTTAEDKGETKDTETNGEATKAKKVAGPPPSTVKADQTKAIADKRENQAKDAETKAGLAKKDDGPKIPRGPLPVNIEEVTAFISIGSLLSDLMDGKLFNETTALNIEAKMLGGSLNGEVQKDAKNIALKAKIDQIELRQLNTLLKLADFPLRGQFSGEIDLEVPLDKKNKPRLGNMEGRLGLSIDRVILGPGQIESPKLKSLGGVVDVPKLGIEALNADLKFGKKRGQISKFSFKGQDVTGDISGYIRLNDQFERWRPNLYLRFKFSDPFLKRESAIKTLMTSISYVRRGTAKDGFTGFTMTGVMDSPTFRPRKTNPHARAKRASPRNRRASTARPPRDRGGSRAKKKRPKSGAKPAVKPGRRSAKAKPTSRKRAGFGTTSKSRYDKATPSRPARGRAAPPVTRSASPLKLPPRKPEPVEEDEDTDEDDEEERVMPNTTAKAAAEKESSKGNDDDNDEDSDEGDDDDSSDEDDSDDDVKSKDDEDSDDDSDEDD